MIYATQSVRQTLKILKGIETFVETTHLNPFAAMN